MLLTFLINTFIIAKQKVLNSMCRAPCERKEAGALGNLDIGY